MSNDDDHFFAMPAKRDGLNIGPPMTIEIPSTTPESGGIGGYSVGQSNLGEMTNQGPKTTIFRYVVILIIDLAVTFGAYYQLNLEVLPSLIILAALAFFSIFMISLIDTRQAFGLANSLLDFWLNRRRMTNAYRLEERRLEIFEGLTQYQMRHQQNLQRWSTMHQLGMLETQKLESKGGKGKTGLAKRVVRDEPGALVDTIEEDQMAELILSFLMQFFHDNEEAAFQSIKSNGEITLVIPWGEDGAMDPAEKEMALRMIRQVNAKNVQPILMKQRGKKVWTFNKRYYDRPLKVIAAFDAIYQ